MALFLLNPEKRFYVRELARKINANINSVRRELHKLETVGLLKTEEVGNVKYYSVNKKMPIYNELKQIFVKTEGIGEAIKKELGSAGNVERAFIYGSFAEGDEQLKSDIDLMIVGEINEEKLIPLIRRLEEKFGREINYTLLKPEEFRLRKKTGDPFIRSVLKGKKIEIIG
jgi:predicted nucleotidyltransferase